MGGLLELISQLFDILKPILSPTEYETLTKKYSKLREENEKRKERIKVALASGDVDALNILLSELLGLSN